MNAFSAAGELRGRAIGGRTGTAPVRSAASHHVAHAAIGESIALRVTAVGDRQIFDGHVSHDIFGLIDHGHCANDPAGID